MSLDWFIFILLSFVKYTSSSLESGALNSCASVLFMTSDIVASVTFGVIADLICRLDIFTFLTGVDAESDIGGKSQVKLRIIT